MPVSKSLGEAGVYDDLLAQVCRQVENNGLKLHQAEAAIIGTTLIESAAHPRTQTKAPLDREKGDIQEEPQIRFSADEDARWAKNGS